MQVQVLHAADVVHAVESVGLGADYVKSFDGIYPRLAKEQGVLFYPFMLDGVALNRKLNLADGIHPNPDGVKVIVARMLPLLKKLVQQTGKVR